MTSDALKRRLKEVLEREMPLPGDGRTAERHSLLMAVGREDLSLARLAEAHWDALSILHEAGRLPETGAIYGVWASEIAGQPIHIEQSTNSLKITGRKQFCSGNGFVDRALVTVGEGVLVDIDLLSAANCLLSTDSDWSTNAFAGTRTSTVEFRNLQINSASIVGADGWYTARAGFWHGACGPAACWAGGAQGMLDYASKQTRLDPHTLAHLGAISASIWACESYLKLAAYQIDADVSNVHAAQVRALTVRHLIEQACTDVLRRIARTYGPRPLAMDAETSTRYSELDLYLRQSHAERDLEVLGRLQRCLEQEMRGTGTSGLSEYRRRSCQF